MITNLCGGFLATRYSAKGVLALGVVLWSMFTIATPAAAAGNLGELMMARSVVQAGRDCECACRWCRMAANAGGAGRARTNRRPQSPPCRAGP